MEYKFTDIEPRWQKHWKLSGTYTVVNDFSKPKYYVLDMFPYPSGTGLHVGHPLGYIASDIYSRYKRLKGFNVLHPMGFDSFGLPAEQYALETGQHPAGTTKKNIATFKSQLDKIGFCYDWSREVQTSDPGFYKWTQWIFLQLFNSYFCNTQKKALPISVLINKYATKGAMPKEGPMIPGKHFAAEQWNGFSKKEQEDILMQRRLAFSAYGEVNWCEALGTVLANDEVVNGVSERGGHPVEKKKMRQWYLRITDYADRLLDGLDTVAFSESMKEMQRNWIGKSEGAEVEFKVRSRESGVGSGTLKSNDSGLRTPHSRLTVYTTRPDTIFGADFIVLAPEHELVDKITSAGQNESVENYRTYTKSRSDRERLAEVKQITGCFTGAYALHPFDGREIPIWIAEYVLAGYGTGAIMAVPCGDQRDFLFAKHFDISITNIIGDHFNGEAANPTKDAILQNSGFLNGLLMKDAIGVAINKIEEEGIGKKKVNYRMRDAGFSRQRYWGEPFPIIWSDGIAIPLDAEELPLELPHVDKYGPGPDGEGPLANLVNWVDLTPNPSPKERGMKEHSGYINSTRDEWKRTITFAKDNRKNLTEAESILWEALRNRKLDNFKFRRQHPIAGYIPDFVCLDKQLIIELDGQYHNEQSQIEFDKGRELWLHENGFSMIRFSNDEILKQIDNVLKNIKIKLHETIDNKVTESNSPLPWRGAGGEVRRETSTMPGYAGSSWYFLRYMDPHNDQTFCDRKISDYWNQVDLYVGGTEHAVGHLLYSRMWTKVLYDLGLIGFDEPFKKLLNQGMIQGSSRLVYRIDSIGNSRLDFSLFVSNGIAVKCKNDNSYAVDLVNCTLFDEVKNFTGDKFLKDNNVTITQLHIDVKFVDGVELNLEAFRNWKPEYKDAIVICEDGAVSFPLSLGEGLGVRSNSKYICGTETEKMSKSKYNTVNPDVLVEKYGADTFRMYEMFLGPVEASKPWDTKGIEGVHRFLRKLWRLFFDEVKGPIWTSSAPSPLERAGGEVGVEATNAELKILHRTIKKIEEDTERFSFNTAVSTFMICVNELTDLQCHKKEILEPLLILLAPYAPHIAEELYNELNASKVLPLGEDLGGARRSVLDAQFPVYDPKLLIESSKDYPLSINGKLRASITLALDLDQKQVEEIVLQHEVVQKWLEGKAPKKIIFVKNKMINVVI